jgi:hypothetical protein
MGRGGIRPAAEAAIREEIHPEAEAGIRAEICLAVGAVIREETHPEAAAVILAAEDPIARAAPGAAVRWSSVLS